jgi:putative oxidoreductase
MTALDRYSNPDLGLLLLRLWLGLVGILHGGQKLFGLFGGHGPREFADALAGMHVPAPYASAILAGCAEFFGGLLVALGIVPRLAAIPFAITMLVAWSTAHHFKFFSQTGGGEYPLTLAAALLTIIVAGPGRFTLPRLLSPRAATRPA